MLGLQFGRFGVGAISLWLHFKDIKDLKKESILRKQYIRGGGGFNTFSLLNFFLQKAVKSVKKINRLS